MARRKMQKGICRLCKKTTELSFEHIPPKVAFNKFTKYRSIPFIEYVQNSRNPDYKPSGKLMQGGLGEYCLCRDCNSFLGNIYVPSYYRMALIGRNILQNYNVDKIHFKTTDLSPLRLLKQVLAMFICINKPEFTTSFPELLPFVRNPKEQFLPNRYRVYMYLNKIGKTRNLSMMYTNHHGLLCELTFPPLGFVLSIDNPNSIPSLTEITQFKNINLDFNGEIYFEMNVLPTHLPYVADYRTEEEIEETIRKSEEFIASKKTY